MQIFTPSPGLIIIKPIEDKLTAFVSADQEINQTRKGQVLYCGKDFITETGQIIKCPVKKNDIILHSLFGHQDFQYQNKNYRIVKFTEILLRFNEN